jgi:cation/acetate symporter
MVGAGALVQPLLGLPHWAGVLIVGTVVITIVVTAGMVSTTWVQFIKGSMLVIFCAILTVAILNRGFRTYVNTETVTGTGENTVVSKFTGLVPTGPLGPIEFLRKFSESTIVVEKINPKADAAHPDEPKTTRTMVKGSDMLMPGASPTFAGVRSPLISKKLDFISLMLALFCGTASLPHILIRYYTVKDAASARKSTVVGIAAIGFFYVLTLYIGLGAMVGGPLHPDSNMAAPLLARTFGELPFAIISAIAFTTVLGTVSGLILAASGAVAHDIMENFLKIQLHDHAKVGAAKWAAIVVGIIGMALGVVFQKLNVSFLVGWAFNVAASANLPALVMLLFWKRTTKYGITASIIIGLVTSLTWLMLSVPAYQHVYGFSPAEAAAKAIAPFSQPGLVTIPLGFVVLVLVSLVTQPRRVRDEELIRR